MVQMRYEGFKKLHTGQNPDDLMRVIEKDDSNSSVTTDSEEGKALPRTCRETTEYVLNTNKFQMLVISLVILNCLLVVTELLIDLKVFEMGGSAAVPQVLHYLSLSILSLFLLEILIKIYAIRLDYFHRKMEVFDGIVVILAFALDIAFAKEEGLKSGVGLIIVLRLWRVTKILNGIIRSVRAQAERRLAREKRAREALEQELSKFREYCAAQEAEIESLQLLLRKHSIDYQAVEKPVMGETFNVVVEVNEVVSASENNSEKAMLMAQLNSNSSSDTEKQQQHQLLLSSNETTTA